MDPPVISGPRRVAGMGGHNPYLAPPSPMGIGFYPFLSRGEYFLSIPVP